MKLQEITNIPFLLMFESAYPGNLGLAEMLHFYRTATPEQKILMDKIVAARDYKRFRELIKEVLGIELTRI